MGNLPTVKVEKGVRVFYNVGVNTLMKNALKPMRMLVDQAKPLGGSSVL